MKKVPAFATTVALLIVSSESFGQSLCESCVSAQISLTSFQVSGIEGVSEEQVLARMVELWRGGGCYGVTYSLSAYRRSYTALGYGPNASGRIEDDADLVMTRTAGCGNVGGSSTYKLTKVQVATCPTSAIYKLWWPFGEAPYCEGPSLPPPPPSPVPIKIVVDPGHGFKCPEAGMKIGAVGVTNFTTPPVGLLREDNLTMAIANEIANQMPTLYKVILTKRDADSCPSFLTRGRVANNANAKAFVSIHINASGYPLLPPTGTSTLYNVNKSGSFNLADEMARTVSSALAVNNRGAKVDDEIAVLKPTVTNMHAVLLEAARLSGRDEELLHAPTAPACVAFGVVSAIRNFIGK